MGETVCSCCPESGGGSKSRERETDGNDEDEPRRKPSPEPYLGKGKGIDPREFGALEGVDLHELSPEAQVAEYK